MKNEKIALTAIEKEKLSACVALVAKNFELKCIGLEKAIAEAEKEGAQSENLLSRLEHYQARQSFFEALKQKVIQAFENNQI